MTLNEFLGKAGQLIGLAEKNLTTEQSLVAVQAENATLKEKVLSLETISGELSGAKADLVTAKASISSLTTRAEKAESDLKVASDKLANPGEQINVAASRKALEITAGQGQPALNATPSTASTGGKAVSRADFAAMKPTDAVAFFKAGGKLTD